MLDPGGDGAGHRAQHEERHQRPEVSGPREASSLPPDHDRERRRHQGGHRLAQKREDEEAECEKVGRWLPAAIEPEVGEHRREREHA